MPGWGLTTLFCHRTLHPFAPLYRRHVVHKRQVEISNDELIHARCNSPVGFLSSPGPYTERPTSLCTFGQMLRRIAHILATSSLLCVLVPARSSAVE